jgi:hypothetical protein
MVVAVGAIYLTLPPTATPTPNTTPTATPTATPPAGTIPAQTATVMPTPQATLQHTTTPLDEPSPTQAPSGDAAQQLLGHVPETIRPTCVTVPGSESVLAGANCSADAGAIEISYLAYASPESMLADYEDFRRLSGIEAGTGDCSDPLTWPAEIPYNVGGQPAGRVLCSESLGATSIYWTDDRLGILSRATHTGSHHARLVEFWTREAGPFP